MGMRVCNCEVDHDTAPITNWCDECQQFWFDAYKDGYYSGLPGGNWPSPEHIETDAYEYGLLDGRHKALGDSPLDFEVQTVMERLARFQRIMGDVFEFRQSV